jgi:hypothetical protein
MNDLQCSEEFITITSHPLKGHIHIIVEGTSTIGFECNRTGVPRRKETSLE